MIILKLLNTVCYLASVFPKVSSYQGIIGERKRQSPIDINKHNCKPCPENIRELKFLHYWESNEKAEICNDGHTEKRNGVVAALFSVENREDAVSKSLLNVLINNGSKIFIKSREMIPTLTGGPLEGCYELKQTHFHWGEHDNVGSEHTINGRPFSMEVHFVHESNQESGNQENESDNIAVLAFFLQVQSTTDNEEMQTLVDLLCKLKKPHSKVEMNTQDLMKIFQTKVDISDYFTYLGSLTTEPYSENVIWLVNPKPIPISHNQVEEFRKMRNECGKCIKENYRAVQPLNGRCVFYCSSSAQHKCEDSSE